MFEVRKLVTVGFDRGQFPWRPIQSCRVSIAISLFQQCIGGLLTQNTHGERSIRRLVNSAVFLRFRAGSRRGIGIPHTRSGGGGFLCLGVVRHGPGLATHMFLNRISRVLAGGGYCRLWGVSRFWRKWPGTTVLHHPVSTGQG